MNQNEFLELSEKVAQLTHDATYTTECSFRCKRVNGETILKWNPEKWMDGIRNLNNFMKEFYDKELDLVPMQRLILGSLLHEAVEVWNKSFDIMDRMEKAYNNQKGVIYV